jgi:L-lactate dehydrogenase complex protein LldG
MIPSSREKVLAAIKKALADEPKLAKEPVQVPLYQREDSDLVMEFVDNFMALACTFFYCSNDEVESNLASLLEERNLQNVYAWEAPVIDFLNRTGFPHITDDSNFESVEASITMCEALVARTGSIVVSSALKTGRRLTIYPPHHIVIGLASWIVSDIKDALKLMNGRYGANMPSMISFITGASRTADIEKTLVKGAHGPKELTLFLVDDLTYEND